MAKHANGLGYEGDTSSEYPDALESLEPAAEGLMIVEDEEAEEPSRGRHGKAQDAADGKKKKKKDLPPYMRKSRRTRKILIASLILLVLLIAALAYFTVQLLEESRQLAVDQSQQQQSVEEVEGIQQDQTQDASTETVKKTSAPNLMELLGLTQDQAVEQLQRGATAVSSKAVEDEADPVRTNVTVSLTQEPADTRTGTPTVYLGLDEEGLVIQAGYSASVAALGYGAFSFLDAVETNHIVERTLQEAGVGVAEGTAQLPDDKAEYSTYAADGTTLTKEYCPFSGTVETADGSYEWSAVLSYDYSLANAAGASNLSDVIRIIYVYVGL